MPVSVIDSRMFGPSDTAAIDAEKPKPHGICERIASCIRRVFQSICNGIKFIFSGCGLCRNVDTFETLLAEARKDTRLDQHMAFDKLSKMYLALREQFFQLRLDFTYFKKNSDEVNFHDIEERNGQLELMHTAANKLYGEVLDKIRENKKQKKIRQGDYSEKPQILANAIISELEKMYIGDDLRDYKRSLDMRNARCREQ